VVCCVRSVRVPRRARARWLPARAALRGADPGGSEQRHQVSAGWLVAGPACGAWGSCPSARARVCWRRAGCCAWHGMARRGMAWRGVACRSRAPWIRVIPRLAMCVAMSLGASAHWLAARCAGACSDACSDACSGVWAALRGADSRLSVAHFICVVVGGCQLCVWRVSHREPAGWRRAVLRCAAWNNTTRHGTASTSKAPGICVPRCGSGRAVRVGGPCGSCPSSRVLCCAVPPCPLSCVLGMPARAAWARHAAGACGCEWCACCVWLEGGARTHTRACWWRAVPACCAVMRGAASTGKARSRCMWVCVVCVGSSGWRRCVARCGCACGSARVPAGWLEARACCAVPGILGKALLLSGLSGQLGIWVMEGWAWACARLARGSRAWRASGGGSVGVREMQERLTGHCESGCGVWGGVES